MLKTQITGAKYLSPQTNQMTNLNIAVPADSKDTEFGTSDILLAKDTVKLIEDKTKDKDTDKSYFELKLVGNGSVIIDGIETNLKSRQLFRWEGKPSSLVIDGDIGWSDFSHLDTSAITSFENMFKGYDDHSSTTSLNIGNWDVSNVTDMSEMFGGCTNLSNDEFDPNFGLEYWNTSSLTNLYGMFSNCSSINELNLNNFNTAKVVTFANMFYGCTNLKKLDISSFDTSSVDMDDYDGLSYMFYGCSSLKSLILGEGFGKMPDNVGRVDFSDLSEWTDQDSVRSLLTLYDRKANGMGEITLKLHDNTKAVLGSDGQAQLTAKGYRIE